MVLEFLKNLDAFRRLDKGFTESTVHGGCLSIGVWLLMCFLFFMEFWDFMETDTNTQVILDTNQDRMLTIEFNVTLLDLPCEFAAVDVLDAFGWERLNVTANIQKERLHLIDGNLEKGGFHEETEMKHDNEEGAAAAAEATAEGDDADEVDAEGHHAFQITDKQFDHYLRTHDFTFINFFAPWCHWCRALAPTWEETGTKIDRMGFRKKGMKIKIASMDCVKYEEICARFRIRAYPSLLVFKKDKPMYPFYDGHRTVDDLVAHLTKYANEYEQHQPNVFHDQGCQISGWLEVARVPGNFHIEARSKAHNLAPAMTNVSHTVNHLSFGQRLPPSLENRLPTKHRFLMHPLNGRTFIVDEKHQAPQHYIKIVTTMYDFGFGQEKVQNMIPSYQMTTQNRVAKYGEDEVPEAKFTFDLSPVSVIVSQRGTPWYQFLTSLMAIIGGTFTVIQLFDGMVEGVSKKFKRTQGKLS